MYFLRRIDICEAIKNSITESRLIINNIENLKDLSVIRKIRITANDGKNYNTNFYSLDVIIAIGYRVNSKEATDFRIRATNTFPKVLMSY